MADLGASRVEVERARRALAADRASTRELGRQVRPQSGKIPLETPLTR